MRPRRFRRPITILCALVIAAVVVPTTASGAVSTDLSSAQRATLLGYARDTWASFVAMTDTDSGLPADSLEADGTASVQTSTTNIGAYMWSAVVAERLGIIGHAEIVARLAKTIHSLETMERDQTVGADGRPSGQYYNWYDHTTGAKLTVWPPSGQPLKPILSSVDNGWLATGLQVVSNTVPELTERQPDRLLLGEPDRLAMLLRHDRQREPDLELHRDRDRDDPEQGVLRRLADLPEHV